MILKWKNTRFYFNDSTTKVCQFLDLFRFMTSRMTFDFSVIYIFLEKRCSCTDYLHSQFRENCKYKRHDFCAFIAFER